MSKPVPKFITEMYGSAHGSAASCVVVAHTSLWAKVRFKGSTPICGCYKND